MTFTVDLTTALVIIAGSLFGLIIFLITCINILKNRDDAINNLKDQLAKSVSTRKSSEVRLGKTAENFAPLLKNYPYDPYHFKFLGAPIDGIQINKDSIVIVEFKTGNARLTASQKHVKQLVTDGKVRFETFRIDENGTTLKDESKKRKRKGKKS